MLEKVNLQATMMKTDYKQESAGLKAQLSMLQHTMREKKLPVIVLFEGWGTAGKGSRMADMILTLDPRSFTVHSTLPADEGEQRRPFLWRHWAHVPAQGQMAIFDRSWYPEVSIDRIERGVDAEEAARRMHSINTMERQLTDGGCLILKFFLHISQKEQKRRLDRLAEQPATAWRATKRDYKRNKAYEAYYEAFDEMLERTNTPYAPWHVIASHDKYSAQVEIYRILVDQLTRALEARDRRNAEGPALPPTAPIVVSPAFHLVNQPRLEDVALDKTLDPELYKKLLKKAQARLRVLHNEIYRRKIPVVMVYEGWDAAGKGGNIRRMAAALDPRGYEVVPIAAPNPYELAHHYLWRFWRALPKDGHIAIFDRSWYGRVMVERIEGFCDSDDWHRAFQEINEFEQELHDWGAVLLKFWLHIDEDEQLRRFTDRQNTPEKQWKITDEDWRNREKWDQYLVAVNDMIRYTSTDFAPWTVVESQDKRYGRIRTLHTLIRALEARLDE